jgi:hypothetical protein
MDERSRSLQELQHIKQMMERSSRFISLSSLSGISAGYAGWQAHGLQKRRLIVGRVLTAAGLRQCIA